MKIRFAVVVLIASLAASLSPSSANASYLRVNCGSLEAHSSNIYGYAQYLKSHPARRHWLRLDNYIYDSYRALERGLYGSARTSIMHVRYRILSDIAHRPIRRADAIYQMKRTDTAIRGACDGNGISEKEASALFR